MHVFSAAVYVRSKCEVCPHVCLSSKLRPDPSAEIVLDENGPVHDYQHHLQINKTTFQMTNISFRSKTQKSFNTNF